MAEQRGDESLNLDSETVQEIVDQQMKERSGLLTGKDAARRQAEYDLLESARQYRTRELRTPDVR